MGFLLTAGLSSSLEPTRGSSRTTRTKINAVNTVKVTRFRKAVLLVVVDFLHEQAVKSDIKNNTLTRHLRNG